MVDFLLEVTWECGQAGQQARGVWPRAGRLHARRAQAGERRHWRRQQAKDPRACVGVRRAVAAAAAFALQQWPRMLCDYVKETLGNFISSIFAGDPLSCVVNAALCAAGLQFATSYQSSR